MKIAGESPSKLPEIYFKIPDIINKILKKFKKIIFFFGDLRSYVVNTFDKVSPITHL